MSWVTSAFDGFESIDVTKNKRKRPQRPKSESFASSSPVSAISEELWTDIYAPNTKEELAVHKKKIQDVESWILESISGVKNRDYLLITGPSGCAKTATVRVLAKEIGLPIVEWVNPTSVPYVEKTEGGLYYDGFNTVIEPSLTQKFRQFFVRAVKYRNICEPKNSCKNLVLIEDFPNSILKDNTEFNHLLRTLKGSCTNPVIFIVADSPNQQNNVKTLFPPEIQQEMCITNIAFNSIAVSYLCQALTRVATTESYKGTKMASKEIIREYAEASNGDIRSALNSLQFGCSKNINNILLNVPASKKKKIKSSSTTQSKSTKDSSSNNLLGVKDPTLLIFRALGKVLYCKRDPEGEMDTLPEHIKSHQRLPLVEKPETIYDHSTLSASSFGLFLHQNCTSFHTDITNLANTINELADSDVIQSHWDERGRLDNYAASLLIRGTMHYSSEAVTKRSWKPLIKPQWFSVNSAMNKRIQELKYNFQSNPISTSELTTTVIPYSVKVASPETTGLHRNIAHFEKTSLIKTENLQEFDIETESESNSSITLPNKKLISIIEINDENEEDFLIEEIEN